MRNLLVIGVLSVAFSATAFAQDAIVQPLTPQEAAQAKNLYQAKQDADKAWDALTAKLTKQYADKWSGSGILFSVDFRFIVPKPYVTQSNPWGCYNYVCPAIGTITTPFTNSITDANNLTLKANQ